MTEPPGETSLVRGPSTWRISTALLTGALALIAGFHSAVALALIAPLVDLVSGKGGLDVAAFDQAWARRGDAIDVAVAALALVACLALAGGARAVTRAARLGIGAPMALLGAVSLVALAVRPSAAGTYAVEGLASQLSVVALGVLLTWCVHVHVAAAARLDLERVLFQVLTPASLGLATMVGLPVAALLKSPALIGLLGFVSAVAPWVAFAALAQLMIRAGRLGEPGVTSLDVARAEGHATGDRA